MINRFKNKLKTKCNEITELEKCLSDKDYITKKFGEKRAGTMIERDRVELIRRMRALSIEEWEIVINEAPIELCHNRIGRELKEAKEFKKNIGSAIAVTKKEEVW